MYRVCVCVYDNIHKSIHATFLHSQTHFGGETINAEGESLPSNACLSCRLPS